MENELLEKLEAIFGMKASYDLPSSAREQNVLFVELEQPTTRFTGDMEHTRVTGSAVIYSPSEKNRMGSFAKKIDAAPTDLTKDFFFSEVDSNTRMFRDIVGRGFSFTYFFRGQFNPPSGKITEVEFKE